MNPSTAERHNPFVTKASLQGFNLTLQPDASFMNIAILLQEQGLDDVEKLLRRPKAKAEERLREVLEEFVGGCRLACP